MPSNQQRRDAAKRKLQRQLARREKRAAAQRRRLSIIGVVAAVLIVAGGVWLFAGGGSDKPDEAAKSPSNATDGASAEAYSPSGATDSPQASGTTGTADAGSTGAGTGNACSYPAAGTPAKEVDPPSDLNPPDTGTVDATVKLSEGTLTFALDRANAPCAVDSFVSLAQQHYFDDTICHRLTTSDSLKVLQCGDPSGTGTGGPGYSFADELTGDETYQRGTLAMANSGPNTNGSQFFIVYGDSTLQPNYTVLGTVSKGLDVVDGIADKGVDGGGQDGAPAEKVTIESVTIDQ